MLGLNAVGARSIAAGPSGLSIVQAAVAATLTITLGLSVTTGIVVNPSAAFGINFDFSASVIPRQMVSGIQLPISFDLTASVREYGKPIRISALPASYNLRAMPESFDLKALSESFTLRGVK